MLTFTSAGPKLHLDVAFAEIRKRLATLVYFWICFSLLPIFIPIYLIFWVRVYIVWVFLKVRWRLQDDAACAHVACGMDTVWTCDVPGVNYSINTVLFLAGCADIDDIKRRIERQLRQRELRKFRQHLVEIWGVCVWKDAGNFSIDDHVVLESEEAITTDADLQKLLAALSTRPFPKQTPPWQVVVQPLTSQDQEQFCLVFRADHTLSDGLSLVYLLMNHVMDRPGIEPAISRPPPPQSTKYLVYTAWRCLHAFYHTPDSVVQFFTRTERNSLHGKTLTNNKIIRWSRPISLSTLKRIRQSTSATINDIYLSCLSGALHHHLVKRANQNSKPIQPITAIIPISLNSSPDNISCENNISVTHVRLPVHLPDSRSRLSTTSGLMEECKRSPEVLVNAWMCRRLVNCLPLATTRRLFRESPATIVSSTVPGPPAPISLWGHKINSMRYFSPHRGHTGVTACFMSYAGQATLTVYADAALVDKPEDVDAIVEQFNEEVDQLAALPDKLN